MRPTLITAGYHLGRPEHGVGRGPGVLAAWATSDAGPGAIEVRAIAAPARVDHEIGATFAVDAAIASAVRSAREADRLPVVLAGNCLSCVGVLGGLAPFRPGIVWLDAHGDLNTAETTTTGFLDGTALATAIGRCWQTIARGVTGFAPIAEDNVLLIGGRSLDPGERDVIRETTLSHLTETQVRDVGAAAMQATLDDLAARVDGLYLHVDLDVLDPREVPANQWRVPGGLRLTDLTTIVAMCVRRMPIAAVTVASYDPTYDPDHRAREAVGLLLAALGGD